VLGLGKFEKSITTHRNVNKNKKQFIMNKTAADKKLERSGDNGTESFFFQFSSFFSVKRKFTVHRFTYLLVE
jgi:hypothetical protein